MPQASALQVARGLAERIHALPYEGLSGYMGTSNVDMMRTELRRAAAELVHVLEGDESFELRTHHIRELEGKLYSARTVQLLSRGEFDTCIKLTDEISDLMETE